MAPDVKPDQRSSPPGLGTRGTWRKEEYKNTPMRNKGRENIQLLPWVLIGDEECHDLDQPLRTCFSYHLTIQAPEGLHHSPCTGHPSVAGAVLYWNFPPWNHPLWKFLPITTPEALPSSCPERSTTPVPWDYLRGVCNVLMTEFLLSWHSWMLLMEPARRTAVTPQPLGCCSTWPLLSR